MTGYVTSTSLSTTLTGYATVAGDTFTGVITFANTMGLGTDTAGRRLILYPGSTTMDWSGLGIAAHKMVYNVPAALTHNFYIEGTQFLSISQGSTTLNNGLSLISCITINHPTSASLPTTSAHIG